MDGAALEDLRWYVEDYLRVPYRVYEARGPQLAGRIRGWGQTLIEALFGPQPARMAYAALRARDDTELLVRSAAPGVAGVAVGAAVGSGSAGPLALEFAEMSHMLPSAAPQARTAASGKRLVKYLAHAEMHEDSHTNGMNVSCRARKAHQVHPRRFASLIPAPLCEHDPSLSGADAIVVGDA